MKVAVYGRSGNKCMACRATKQYLERQGTEYEHHDVDEDPEALAYVQSVGVQQVPLVVVEQPERSHHWSGFRPDLLRELVATPVVA
jgi:glutaredoxin-like protein NrdH